MIKIFQNFLSEDEIKSLNSWCMNNYTKNFFQDPRMDPNHQRTRLTTRGSGERNAKIDYPKEAYNIKRRLIDRLNLKRPLHPEPFYKGIVNGIGFEKGSIYKHKDPVYFSGTYTLHCNFITQKSIEGGVTFIKEVPYDVNEGDCLSYIVSHQEHEVSAIVGKVPRILWCYGFCINEDELKNIFES
jgi:hypothetical protein